MGHIKEPKNVDFIIKSPPLSDKEKLEISDYIASLKNKRKTSKKKNSDNTKTSIKYKPTT